MVGGLASLRSATSSDPSRAWATFVLSPPTSTDRIDEDFNFPTPLSTSVGPVHTPILRRPTGEPREAILVGGNSSPSPFIMLVHLHQRVLPRHPNASAVIGAVLVKLAASGFGCCGWTPQSAQGTEKCLRNNPLEGALCPLFGRENVLVQKHRGTRHEAIFPSTPLPR